MIIEQGVETEEDMAMDHTGLEHQEEVEPERAEEAIVSMHATSSNPHANTMRFKGQIGQQPVFALIDSGSTHSFVNPTVLQEHSTHIITINPMIVMVANGERMMTDSICISLQFSIQGYEFSHDLRLLSVQGYDVILGLDWLAILGPMQIDWFNKWIEFQLEGKMVKLQVTNEKAVLKLSEAVDVKKEMKAHSDGSCTHLAV
jgi:Retroviral aspartyl protease